jgi:Tfp pilus assembly protein PilV
MVEGRTLPAFRDITVIIGIAVLCFLGMQDAVARSQARREQEARFAVARNAMARMNEAYRQAVANKSINEQIFRQNELLIQYQELMVTLAYMPAIPVQPAAANKSGGAAPAPPPSKPQAPPSKP